MRSLQPQLRGRTALVTGAGGSGTGGIGRGIALALASAGANVVVAARRKDLGDETASLIALERGTALVVQCDVSVRADVEAAVSAAVSTFGGLDVVVHNAVNHRDGESPLALEEITDADWHAQASVAWDGAYYLTQATLPHLKRSGRGSFILLGSASGLRGASLNPVFSALKGGYRGFIKALAREWAPHNITVNSVNPMASVDENALLSRLKSEFGLTPQAIGQITGNLPMGRMGRPREDIGRAVVAICSDDFGFVTAQSIQVDGGVYTAL
jgi:3-oxoacyl-[acyl-carrier protein] reductase